MKPTEQEILDRLAKARNAYLDRDYTRALMDYLWVAEQIKDDPDNLPIVQIEIGWSYYYSKKYEKAIDEAALDFADLAEEVMGNVNDDDDVVS